MTLAALLLDLLVCPEDKGPLWYIDDEAVLYNERLQRKYSVSNGGIPVLLIDEAETVDGAEHERLITKAKSQDCRRTGTDTGNGSGHPNREIEGHQ